jgi:hypothetical protein
LSSKYCIATKEQVSQVITNTETINAKSQYLPMLSHKSHRLHSRHQPTQGRTS